jgi:hypothetical protein
VPIPATVGPGVGAEVNYAGLLSVQLPAGVRAGESFDVVVRQVTNAFGRAEPAPAELPRLQAAAAASGVGNLHWRRVLGAFQLTIPVRPKHLPLPREERDLSVLLWIVEAIPTTSRWYQVFGRYLELIAGRVSAFGGDPGAIQPSPTGDGGREPERGERLLAFTGKITALIFDHYGDFEGFILDTEDGPHTFHSRETHIRNLAERVWRERLRLTVRAERHARRRPTSIRIHEPPAR